jgi:non-ribosomal peptide synthetase component F
MPRATLLNIYGSSEVAADATWHEVTQPEEDSYVLIGRPIHNILPGGGATATSDREALLARLDKLPEGELQELLKRVLQDKGAADRPKVPDSS